MQTLNKPSISSRRTAVRVQAAAWQKVSSKSALQSAGGKTVVEVSGQKVLLAMVSRRARKSCFAVSASNQA